MALVCLLGLGVVVTLSTVSYFPSGSMGLSRWSGVRFAIADFDGDWKPDVAVVETANFHPVQTDYSVHLQFSASPELFFLVNAPTGGIRLAARDVNGDNLPDIVVSSVSDHRVVAILLNKGHGQFSRAELAVYAGLASEADLFLRGTDQTIRDQFTVVSLRYSFDGNDVRGPSNSGVVTTDSLSIAQISVFSSAAPHARRGRSPPGRILFL